MSTKQGTTGQVQVMVIDQAKLEEARSKSAKLLEKARAFIVLDHPFFATILLRKPLIEDVSVGTLGVTNRGTIYYNPLFVADLTPNQVVWALTHEVLHYASGHGLRCGMRDKAKWNIAGDRWINDTLNEAKVGEKIPGCEDVPGSAQRTVEDIYAGITDQDMEKYKGDGLGQDIKGDKGEEEGQGSAAEAEAQRRIDVAEAATVAKIKGKLPGILAQFAADTIESKVPWFDILEKYMVERVRNDYSWARPNRRYAPDFYLPVVDGVGAMGEVVCQVDISGSVSKDEISAYNGHMKRIVELCRPSRVHVLYVDTTVQRAEVFDRPEDLQINFYSGGGTDMRAGINWVEKQGIQPEVFICLTDGFTPYPDSEPSFPTVWCISSKEESPVGRNIHFELEH
jgi:predicted metal-dependent peptidase